MELVEGESYAKILKREKRLSLADIMHLIVSACQGLDHAHHRGIVHRDLKPSNILLTKEHRGQDSRLRAGPADPTERRRLERLVGRHPPVHRARASARRGDRRAHRLVLVRRDVVRARVRARTVHRGQLVGAPHANTAATTQIARARRSRRARRAGDALPSRKILRPRFQSAGEVLSYAQAAGLV